MFDWLFERIQGIYSNGEFNKMIEVYDWNGIIMFGMIIIICFIVFCYVHGGIEY